MSEEFSKYLNRFRLFFPLGIANKKTLLASAFNSSFSNTNINTICWRFSTFVFNETNEFILTRTEWREMIKKRREQFNALQKMRKNSKKFQENVETSQHETINSKLTVSKMLQSLVLNYMVVADKFNKSILNSLFNVLDFFINDETPDHVIEAVCSVMCRIYIAFVEEIDYFEKITENVKIEGDESFEDLKFLFSRDGMYSDIYGCMKGILAMICPFLDKDNNDLKSKAFSKLAHHIQSCSPRNIKIDDNEALLTFSHYQKLFFIFKVQRKDYKDLLTAIFSCCPQSSIFHILYSWMYSNNVRLTVRGLEKMISEDDNAIMTGTPIGTKYLVQAIGNKMKVISRNSYSKSLTSIKKIITHLQELVEKEESDEYSKNVVKYQLHQISRVLQNQIYIEEIVPVYAFYKK